MYDEMEPMPSMQRLITLGDVIYVHANQMRRRRASAPPPLPEPVGLSTDNDTVPSPEEFAQVAVAVDADAAEAQVAEEKASGEADLRPGAWSTWVEGARGFTAQAPTAGDAGWDNGIPRSRPVPPPPGYAIEFGTGRMVPVHSLRGRMSYPSSENG